MSWRAAESEEETLIELAWAVTEPGDAWTGAPNELFHWLYYFVSSAQIQARARNSYSKIRVGFQAGESVKDIAC